MFVVVFADPVMEYVVGVTSSDGNSLISRETCNKDNYFTYIDRALLSYPIEKISCVGIFPYIVQVMEELKIKYPSIIIDGQAILDSGAIEKIGEKKEEE